MLLSGFEYKKTGYFVFAGVSLGLAYLTKEASLLFFPTGVLMWLWIGEYRNSDQLKRVGVSLITLFLSLLPWIFYLWKNDALSYYTSVTSSHVQFMMKPIFVYAFSFVMCQTCKVLTYKYIPPMDTKIPSVTFL